MKLPPEEPPAGDRRRRRPQLSGKTTLSRRLAEAVPGAAVVHTDDIAWWHAAFDWADLLAAGVLEPVRAGRAAPTGRRPGTPATAPARSPSPPASPCWSSRASARPAAPWPTCSTPASGSSPTWTSSTGETPLASKAGEIFPADFDSWMAEEVPFLAADRPWERAALIVAGTPPLAHDPRAELVVATRR